MNYDGHVYTEVKKHNVLILPLHHRYMLDLETYSGVKSRNTLHALYLKMDSHLRSMASQTTDLESMTLFSPSPPSRTPPSLSCHMSVMSIHRQHIRI